MTMPYFPFYGRDFRDGVRRMKEDEIGVYVLVLTLIYESHFGAIPDNDADIAADMGRSVRVWRRVRARLIELGKLQLKDGWLTNPRADAVIEERDRISGVRSESGKRGGKASGEARRNAPVTEVSPKFRESFGKTLGNLSDNSEAKSPQINDIAEANASKAKSNTNSSTAANAAAERAPLATRPLDRCLAVAGPGLADPAKYPTLHLTAARIAAAIHAGCDLELDILPVIAARTSQPRASPITSWTYFERAWADHRDQRLAAFAPTATGDTHAKARNPSRRGTGSFVDAAVRLIDRTRPAHDDDAAGELVEGEVAPARRVGAG